MMIRRHLPTAAALAAVAVFAASPALAGADRVSTEAPLVSYGSGVPEGAVARVYAEYTPAGDTAVTLRVSGLRPATGYGAHVHVAPCGPRPADAGPHEQNVPAPPDTPTDPAYANPDNEIWLDLTTDEGGDGVATSTVAWQLPPDHHAGSVVLHAEHTHTGAPGSPGAGTAGPPVACLTVEL